MNTSIIGALIGALAAVIAIIINLMQLLPKINKNITNKRLNRLREYQKEIKNDSFICFQNEVLKTYYKDHLTNVEGINFPLYTFDGVPYQFEDLINKKLEVLESNYIKNIDYKRNKYYKKYKAIISPNVKYPNRLGFMLENFTFNDNGEISQINAKVGRYEDVVYTCYILEYEMFCLFKKYKNFTIDIYEKIKKKLIIRNLIHSNESTYNILSTGLNRYPIFGIQLAILFKDHNDSEYKMIFPRRSEVVATFPGYLIFTPAGTFEAHDSSYNSDWREINDDFSIVDAIFREYLEELFDEPFDGGNNIIDGAHRIRTHPEVQSITNMIKNKTAFFEFLGSTISFINLVQELCFLLRIDDEDYSRAHIDGDSVRPFKLNYETYTRNLIYSLSNIEDKIINDKVHPASIGLWHLLKKNRLFKERTEK